MSEKTYEELPPLEPVYSILAYDTRNHVFSTAPIAPNPTPDREQAIDACKMLHETTGGDYAILAVTQAWEFATFDYVVYSGVEQ